jgi:N-methylhydantoinase A
LTEPVRIGVDVGGTFTDVVVAPEGEGAGGEILSLKTPTTPNNPLEGIFHGLSQAATRLGGDLPGLLADASSFVHGTTVCTNLMVQRAGAKVGLITTEGFRDTLALRRGIRASIWDMKTPSPPSLVPRHLRRGVRERMDCFGKPLVPLDGESAAEALAALEDEGVEAIAVCLFNGYANGEHERAIKARALARMPGIPVMISSEVLPVMGEYERVSTTVINAYVAPGAGSYLEGLDSELRAGGLSVPPLIMQGNGGVTDIKRSVSQPGQLILSGPAAVAAAALQAGEALGGGKEGERGDAPNLIVFDMGGTSCDITVVADGQVSLFDGLEIEGHHLAAPSLEISTIGTGGGTIAFVDPGGMLRVGPHGAGADPGPACYGRGGRAPTVTDAHLVLGRLGDGDMLGEEITLDRAAAEDAVHRRIAEPLGLSTAEASLSIVRVATQNMIDAIEMISVKKGRDPREFTLIAAGGAGPLHAGALGEALGIGRVLVPRDAAVFSALGLLHADLRRDYVQTFIGELEKTSPQALKEAFGRLRGLAAEEVAGTGVPAEKIRIEFRADLRYRGQNWDIPVVIADIDDPGALESLAAAFHDRHETLYGHRDPESAIDFSGLRVTAIAATPPLAVRKRETPDEAKSARGGPLLPPPRRNVFPDAPGPAVSTPVISGDSMTPGQSLSGPAVIVQPNTTLWVAPENAVEADAYGNLVLTKKGMKP